MNREFVENFLRLNGIGTNLSPNELSHELKKVGWSESDASDAVSALRGDERKDQLDTTNKMLYVDSVLSPEAVVSLLNIHVQHRSGVRNVITTQKPTSAAASIIRTLIGLFLSVIVAGAALLIAMYYLKIGPFYE